MKSINTLRARRVAIACVLPMTLQAGIAFAGGHESVCAVTRDVSTVSGRGGPQLPQLSCRVESKVMAVADGRDVSSIMGRATPMAPAQRGDTTLTRREADTVFNVSTVYGNGPYIAPQRRSESTALVCKNVGGVCATE